MYFGVPFYDSSYPPGGPMRFIRTSLFLLLISVVVYSLLDACTIAVVSGRCTRDGRPLLWKHRDTGQLQNALLYFNTGKYPFVGLIDVTDSLRQSVWVGCNSAGFAIMNSQSYNLILKDTVALKDQEGIVMKLALERCATLEDFEALLRGLPKPLGCEANFGVIDAQGGAAFYEVDNFTFRKLDVNDLSVAPFGYVVHTNFSFTGDMTRGMGQVRYATADNLFHDAFQKREITPKFILQEGSRCLLHSLTKTDLRTLDDGKNDDPIFSFFEDFIPRHSSASSVVIQGVQTGESPDFTTMWAVLGFPLTSVVTPVWVAGGSELPSILIPGTDGLALQCNRAMALKSRLFPITYSYGSRYIQVRDLYNRKGTGILQQLKPLEEKIFLEAGTHLERWRKELNHKKEIPKFYRWLEETVQSEYRSLFRM